MIVHWLRAMRPKTLPAAMCPVAVGSSLAWSDEAFQMVPALLCLAFALLIQIGTNFANDYFDFKKGADTADRKGPARAVASGWITPKAMWLAARVVLGLAVLAGLALIPYGGWWLLGIGLASVLCAVWYTGGPRPLAYVGLGDVFVVLFFGLVATGFTYYVQAGSFSIWAWALGLCMGLLINNLLVVNNLRDIEEDRAANKRTLIVRFGLSFGRIQYQISATVACMIPLCLALFADMTPLFLPAMTYPLGRVLGMQVFQADSPERYGRCLERTSLFLVLYTVCLCGALVWMRG